tara:strand:- start:7296 stop:7988 length:693 start_codon:yes stop_codon:yes gene_type:complete
MTVEKKQLTPDKIKKPKPAQIEQLTPDQIEQLTPETIQSFNKEQLLSFTKQLQSFTKQQIETLSDDLFDEVYKGLLGFICDSVDIYVKTDDENVRKTQLDDIEKLLNLFFYINGLRYTNIDATATVINRIIPLIPRFKRNINLFVLLRKKILQPGEDASNVAVLGTYGQAERVQNIIESITDDPDHTGSGYNKVYTSTKHRRRTTKRKSRKRVTKKKPRKRRKKYRSLSK